MLCILDFNVIQDGVFTKKNEENFLQFALFVQFIGQLFLGFNGQVKVWR